MFQLLFAVNNNFCFVTLVLRWWPVVFASWYLVFLWQDTFAVKFTKDAKIYSILYMIIHVYTLFSMHEYNQVFLDTYSTVAFLIFIMSFMYIFLLHTLLNHRFQGIEYNTWQLKLFWQCLTQYYPLQCQLSPPTSGGQFQPLLGLPGKFQSSFSVYVTGCIFDHGVGDPERFW